jgi:16S rRNA (cytidine1402-2'-O)-methyltransferase
MARPHNVQSPGVLYVVATPIGNLDDISSRARAVLGDADLIAAEDTRRTRQLLDHLGIGTPLVALHEHNERQRAAGIVERVIAGESVALVSDAGTPLISDPGFRLVALARQRGLTVTAIPGCCAAIAALSVAGLPTARFHFEGFLPSRPGTRRARLQAMKSFPDTMVFYEAVHRIGECLADMALAFGEERGAFVARELTKLHESAYSGTLGRVHSQLAADAGGDKGEFTVIVAGAPDSGASASELERVVTILAAELPATQAAAIAARLTGAARRDAYQLALRCRPSGE